MALNKKIGILFLLGALTCATFQPASADEPVKQEQTVPAEGPSATQPTPPQPASMQPSPNETVPQPVMAPSYEGAFVKMIVTVIGLVSVVLLTVWALRKIGQGRFRGFGSHRSIQIIERKPLSPKSMLYLVEVGHQKFLIAESQLEVRRLGMIEELSETASDETT